MNLKEWTKFLEELLEWCGNLDCEEPAGFHCSKLDLRGGEDPCMPCRCKEAYENVRKI